MLDIRDLDWDRDYLWKAIMAAYPYGLTYEEHPDAALRKLDESIRALTRCLIPVIRADWFVATATRPPLYHTLLKLPRQAGELERQLKVDVHDNFRRNRLDRAGFTRSGVSEQNRPRYNHFIIRPGEAIITGWHQTNDRADSFLVTEYGKGAMSQVAHASRAKVGVLTVTFALAWQGDNVPEEEKGSRNAGGNETGFGPPVQVKQQEVKRTIGVVRDVLSVRYTR